MSKSFRARLLATVLSVAAFVFVPTVAAQAASLYGALFEAGHLEASDGANDESLLMYYPEEDGFIAATQNDTGSEWWVSDALGLNWTLAETNPLTEYGCTSPGRHTMVIFNNDVYFAANCGNPEAGLIFKLTGQESVELVHTNTVESEGGEILPGYPTGTVLGDSLYMFFNGGFTSFDGTTWADVTDADGQTDGVPLEVSAAQDGFIYLASNSGEVQTFDGTAYTTIGEGYLENLEQSGNTNLPAIEAFNDTVYVGNQDFENGASIFRYDEEDETWTEAAQLDSEDRIVNKMQQSAEIDGEGFLVFYTANGTLGTSIYSVDENDTIEQLIDSGLGGENPANNTEVVSVVNRTVMDGNIEKTVMLFGTQNMTDQTKVFVLNLGTDLAIDASGNNIVGRGASSFNAKANTSKLDKGTVFQYKLKKSEVVKGATYTLWVNGKQVDEATANKKKALTLKYKKAKRLAAGKSFKVRIGVQYVYGQGDDQVESSNVIKGDALTVKVKKAKKSED